MMKNKEQVCMGSSELGQWIFLMHANAGGLAKADLAQVNYHLSLTFILEKS